MSALTRRDCLALLAAGVSLPCLPALAIWRDQATCAFTADAALPGARDLAGHWREALDTLIGEE